MQKPEASPHISASVKERAKLFGVEPIQLKRAVDTCRIEKGTNFPYLQADLYEDVDGNITSLFLDLSLRKGEPFAIGTHRTRKPGREKWLGYSEPTVRQISTLIAALPFTVLPMEVRDRVRTEARISLRTTQKRLESVLEHTRRQVQKI